MDRKVLLGLVAAAALLAGCAGMPGAPPVAVEASPWAMQSGNSHWEHYLLPGKAATRYSYQRVDGRDALAAAATTSASMMRRKLRVEPGRLGKLHFSWLVPELISRADLGRRDKADSPVRVILAFDGDRSRFSSKNSMLSELAHSLTGEPMPYATLMYVWCNSRPAGTVIASPRTDRIRKLVVQSGPMKLNQWLDYERDVRADYQRAFGEMPGALVGIAVMTDTDNTRSSTRAWYGPVSLQGASGNPF